MTQAAGDADRAAIRAIIERQFASICWTPERRADWQSFAGDFLPQAQLFPAARPVAIQSVETFMARMKGLSASSLRMLHEKALGSEILVFGNIAVALAGCEITENGKDVSRGVEAMLFVKTENGEWKIAAQGWDIGTDGTPLPENLG